MSRNLFDKKTYQLQHFSLNKTKENHLHYFHMSKLQALTDQGWPLRNEARWHRSPGVSEQLRLVFMFFFFSNVFFSFGFEDLVIGGLCIFFFWILFLLWFLLFLCILGWAHFLWGLLCLLCFRTWVQSSIPLLFAWLPWVFIRFVSVVLFLNYIICMFSLKFDFVLKCTSVSAPFLVISCQ